MSKKTNPHLMILMDLIDDNKDILKEGDYLVICNSMKELFKILRNISSVSKVEMDFEQIMFDLHGRYPDGVEEAINEIPEVN